MIDPIYNGSNRHSVIFTPEFGRDADTEKKLTIVESNPAFSFQWAARFSELVKDEEQAELLKTGGIHSMYAFFYDRSLFSLVESGKMESALNMVFELIEVCVTNPLTGGRLSKSAISHYLAEPDTIEELFKIVLYVHTIFFSDDMSRLD